MKISVADQPKTMHVHSLHAYIIYVGWESELYINENVISVCTNLEMNHDNIGLLELKFQSCDENIRKKNTYLIVGSQ